MKKKRPPQVLVIGDSDPSAEAFRAAIAVGKLIAELKATVITGGLGGVMEGASKGASEAGGTVVGVIPGLDLDSANNQCNVVIPTGSGHARNILNVQAADVVIAIGGGAGTLSEMSFAWIYRKPILALKGLGGWSDELADRVIDTRQDKPVQGCQDMVELEDALRACLIDVGFEVPA